MELKTIAVVMMAAGAASAQPSEKFDVHLSNSLIVPMAILRPAQQWADQMFAGVGVRLHWRAGTPPPAGSTERRFVVEFKKDTPWQLRPGVFAYAQPYEGVHIVVFYDRIQKLGTNASVLLAHVMVHEIAHLLEGSDRHSTEGIMRAHWTPADFEAMRVRPLLFTETDIELIRQNLAVTSPSR